MKTFKEIEKKFGKEKILELLDIHWKTLYNWRKSDMIPLKDLRKLGLEVVKRRGK